VSAESEPAEPEPIESAEPEPAEPEQLESAESEPAEPESIESAEPEPIESAEPEPIESAEPEPIESAEPEPIESAEPEQLESTEPKKQIHIGPFELSPIPKAPYTRRNVSSRTGKTAIISSSPFKNELMNSQRPKDSQKRKILDDAQQNPKKLVKRGKAWSKTSRVDLENKNEKKQKKRSASTSNYEETKKRRRPEKARDNGSSACFYCLETFSDEGWVACQSCEKWAHNSCAGVDKKTVNFFCEFCSD